MLDLVRAAVLTVPSILRFRPLLQLHFGFEAEEQARARLLQHWEAVLCLFLLQGIFCLYSQASLFHCRPERG